MDDVTIMQRISALIAREHELRSQREDGGVTAATELSELAEAEVLLDQCWDLLRQRRAKRDFGANPDEAAVRPPSVVERYWQ